MRKVALVNQKGGVGKTTTAVNLSAALSRLDRRVLLLDLDPQANTTISLGIAPHQQKHTCYSVLTGARPQPIVLSPNLHVIPANIDLAGAEMELSGAIGRESVLRDALAEVAGYDFVLLDCPPSLGIVSVNALTYVNEVVIPLQCEFLALHGISLLMRTVDLIKKRLNPGLEITGVVPCMYDARKSLARETVVEIENFFKDKVFKAKIRANVRLAEAPSHGKTIFDYAPESNGAEDYMALAREIAGIVPIPPAPLPPSPVEVLATAGPPSLMEGSARAVPPSQV